MTSMKLVGKKWLPDMDLNHDKQIQSLLCYRYTIGQLPGTQANRFPSQVKPRTCRPGILTTPTDA